MTLREYHLGELEIARSNKDLRHIMPPLPGEMKTILDIGCGAGQTLIACEISEDVLAVGLDIDEEALKLGTELTNNIVFIKGAAEALPFRDKAFDVVISRVTLPYTLIPQTLREIARVLKPQGQVWFTLHPFSMLPDMFLPVLKNGNMRSIVYQVYILINSLLFHLTGRMFRYPLNRSRCESVQTPKGIRRALRRAGFTRIKTELNNFFVVSALKSALPLCYLCQWQATWLTIRGLELCAESVA